MTGAGGIDWIARWRDMRRAVEDFAARHQAPRAADPWAHRAARFDRMARRQVDPHDPTVEALASLCRADDTVLDIGAGAGRHAVSLARRVARVVAVEPSPAMRASLAARVAEEGLENVRLVADPWPPSGPVTPADLVYSCHVLYVVDEVEPFLRAMTRASRRRCAVVLGLRSPTDQLAPLWSSLQGSDRPPRPAALEALAVLHQLGLRADLTVLVGPERPLQFRDDEEDLVELCHRLELAPTPEMQARLRAALTRIAPLADGIFTIGAAAPNALLTWGSGV